MLMTSQHNIANKVQLPLFSPLFLFFIIMALKLRMAYQEFSIALVILVVLCIDMNLQGVIADYGGWESAHATFYGGGDASGTMGEFSLAFHSLLFYVSLIFNENFTAKINNKEKN